MDWAINVWQFRIYEILFLSLHYSLFVSFLSFFLFLFFFFLPFAIAHLLLFARLARGPDSGNCLALAMLLIKPEQQQQQQLVLFMIPATERE